MRLSLGPADDPGRVVAHLLARDRLVVSAFKRAYGPDAIYFLRALRRGRWDAVEEADPDVRDVLTDVLGNDARLYARFLGRGPDENDRYHIDVLGLGGVYFVRAAEFGDSDLFRSMKEAVSWVEFNWNTNLISRNARRYRKPFSPQGKDCARRLPRMSSSQLALARRRQSKRLEQARERQAAAERAAAGPATLVSICSVDVWEEFSTIRYHLLLDGATPSTEGYGLWVRDSKVSLWPISCPPGLTPPAAAKELAQEFIRRQSVRFVHRCAPGDLLTTEDLNEIETALTGKSGGTWTNA